MFDILAACADICLTLWLLGLIYIGILADGVHICLTFWLLGLIYVSHSGC